MLWVIVDPFRLDHLPDGLRDLGAGNAHGSKLCGIEIDLRVLSNVPLAAMGLEEHSRLVGSAGHLYAGAAVRTTSLPPANRSSASRKASAPASV